MHGPTWTFWTNLTPFSLQTPRAEFVGKFTVNKETKEEGYVYASEEDAKLAQKLGQPQPLMAVSLLECMGQLASFGPT
jgi:hypothetical protein